MLASITSSALGRSPSRCGTASPTSSSRRKMNQRGQGALRLGHEPEPRLADDAQRAFAADEQLGKVEQACFSPSASPNTLYPQLFC